MGYKVNRDTPPMERELTYLLDDLCVKWGFCISDISRISKSEHYSAEKFAQDVLLAEGMEPEHNPIWRQKISERFRERFGEEEIHTTTFVDRIRGEIENW